MGYINNNNNNNNNGALKMQDVKI